MKRMWFCILSFGKQQSQCNSNLTTCFSFFTRENNVTHISFIITNYWVKTFLLVLWLWFLVKVSPKNGHNLPEILFPKHSDYSDFFRLQIHQTNHNWNDKMLSRHVLPFQMTDTSCRQPNQKAKSLNNSTTCQYNNVLTT